MQRPACKAPTRQFIVGSKIKSRLDSLERKYATSAPSCRKVSFLAITNGCITQAMCNDEESYPQPLRNLTVDARANGPDVEDLDVECLHNQACDAFTIKSRHIINKTVIAHVKQDPYITLLYDVQRWNVHPSSQMLSSRLKRMRKNVCRHSKSNDNISYDMIS